MNKLIDHLRRALDDLSGLSCLTDLAWRACA